MNHPAQWSKPVMAAILELVEELALEGPFLDQYAGVNGLEFLERMDVIGNELELVWAAQILHQAVVGLAQELPLRDGSVKTIITSHPFANRMGDRYEGSDGEKCRDCSGHGFHPFLPKEDGTAHRLPESKDCARCEGRGRAKSTRRTYVTALGGQPTVGSSAATIWTGKTGKEYREITSAGIEEAFRVLDDGGFLLMNIKDHLKSHGPKGEKTRPVRKFVVDWLLRECLNDGFRFVRCVHVPSKDYAFGENREVRVDGEEILVLVKPTADNLRWP